MGGDASFPALLFDLRYQLINQSIYMPPSLIRVNVLSHLVNHVCPHVMPCIKPNHLHVPMGLTSVCR